MISVVNVKNHLPTNNDFYIGRGSILGNPYSHFPGTSAKEIVNSRNEAIEKYIDYLEEKINEKDESIIKELQKILEIAKYNDVNLICFCMPKRCHGTVIKKIINEKLMKNTDFYDGNEIFKNE